MGVTGLAGIEDLPRRSRKGIMFNPREAMLHVREAFESDTNAVFDFFKRVTPETWGVWSPHPMSARMAEDVCCRRSKEFPYLSAIIALREGRVVGYCCLYAGVYPSDIDRNAPMCDANLYPDVFSIAPCVDDDQRGLGIGKLLVNHAMSTAAILGASHVALIGGVRADNVRALRLYQHCGMQIVGWFGPPSPLWTSPVNYDMVKAVGVRHCQATA